MLEQIYSTDPRFSHVFACFESARQVFVFLAEMQLECPAELYPNPPKSTLVCGSWKQDLCNLDQWRLRVSLTVVKAPQHLPMSTQASHSWDFPVIEAIKMLENTHFSERVFAHEDICFQFRWRQLRCSRVFGLWMRDRRAYTVFVLRNNRFTIAVQRPPQIIGLDRVESLVGSSMRDYELPIMFARCESWKPGGDFTFHLRHCSLVI